MSVEIASLIIQIDATQATEAEKRLQSLTAEGKRVDEAMKKVAGSANQESGALQRLALETQKATTGSKSFVAAKAEIERATRSASAASNIEATLLVRNAEFRANAERMAAKEAQQAAKLEATAARERARETQAGRRLEAAVMAEMVRAYKEYERDLKAAAAAETAMQQRVAALRASIDPTAAAIDRLNQELREAGQLFLNEKISGGEYGRAVRVLQGRIDALNVSHVAAGKGAKLQAYELTNLGQNLADVGVSLASGQAIWLVAIQQGAQIGAVLAEAATRGVSLKSALADVASGAASLLAQWGPLLATAGALGVAILAAVEGYNQMRQAQDAAAASSGGFASAMAQAEEALHGVTLATYKLADARKEAARQALSAEIAENDKRLKQINNPSFWGSVGRGVGTIVGTYRGAEVAREAELIKQRQAALMRQGIGLVLQGPTSRDAAKLLDEVLPKEAALNKLRDERVQVEKMVRAGLIDSATAQRAYNSLDKEATDLMRAKKAPLSEAQKAAKKYAEELRRAKEATADFISGLEMQAAAAGQTSNAVRRLSADREIEKALLRSDIESGLRIKSLVLEIETYEDLGNALREVAAARKSAIDDVSLVGGLADPFISLPTDVEFADPDKIEELAKAFERAAQQADELRWTVGSIRDAIKNNDWAGAFAGLFNVLARLKTEFANAKTAAGKIGAVASAAGVVGGLIGGKVGGVLSGAASGAAAGAAFGVPGAIIGGLLGGIGSLFGSSKAKKQARAEQERQRLEAEAARQLEIANTKRSLEIELLEAANDNVGALAKTRQAELDALDPSLRSLQAQVWAAQDAKKAAEERASVEIRLMEATGNAVGALAARRKAELATIDASNRALLEQVFAAEDAAALVNTARDAVTEAYQRETAAIQETISAAEAAVNKFETLSNSLKKLKADLTTGAAAGLSPENAYLSAKSEFDRLAAMPAGSEERLAGIEDATRAYVEASRAFYASSPEFFADLEKARIAVTATEAYASSQVDVAKAQLAAAQSQLAALEQTYNATLGVQGAILTLAQAIDAYNSALQAQLAAQAQTPATAQQQPDWGSYLNHYADVAKRADEGVAEGLIGPGKEWLSREDWARFHFYNSGQAEGRTPFATGGIITRPMTVGESGIAGERGKEAILPLTNINGSLGVRASNDDSRLVAALERVAAKQDQMIKELQAQIRQTAAATKETSKKLDENTDAVNGVKKAVKAA